MAQNNDFPKIVCIIPARGGSKGIPQKNIAKINGVPMIVYVIKAALNSNLFARVIVSTDDSDIRKVAEKAGAECLHRPTDLAGDLVDHQLVAQNVLANCLDRGSSVYEFAVVIQPTSPLLRSSHLVEAMLMYFAHYPEVRSCVAVTKSEVHPWKLFEMLRRERPRTLIPCVDDGEHLNSARQSLPEFYRLTGAFYIFPVVDFLDKQTYFLKPIMPYFMDPAESVDVDTPEDLLLAEAILMGGGNGHGLTKLR